MRASTQHLQSGQPLPCARRRQVAAYASKTARKPGKEKAASSDKGANQQAKQRARVLQEERSRSTKAADEVQKVLRDAGAVIKNVEAATLSGAYLCWSLLFHCPGADLLRGTAQCETFTERVQTKCACSWPSQPS